MQQNDKLSGIVVYTIHDNKDLRDALREGIKEFLCANELDYSTYGISINSDDRQSVINTLLKICDDARKSSSSDFLKDDFVCLYYPSRPEESGKDRYIIRVDIPLSKTI